MGKKKMIKEAVAFTTALCSSKEIQKLICGKYADGTTRSIADAINGEIYSPKQKADSNERVKKRKKKNKKKKKKKLKMDDFFY